MALVKVPEIKISREDKNLLTIVALATSAISSLIFIYLTFATEE